MEVPVINRISEFDVGINSMNDPLLLPRPFAVSGAGKLHHAYSFLKCGALLLLAFFASFTITRVKCLVLRLRNVDVPSLPSPTLVYEYDSDSDSSCSSDSSDDEEDNDDKEDDDSVNGDSRVKRFSYYEDNDDKGINGNVPWLRRCSSSFGDLLSWPDLGGFGSSGVVKLWDNLDLKGSHEAVASFFNKYGASSSLSPAVVLAAEKKGSDAVEVSAWDARDGFMMPALLAEWRQPGRLLGKIVRVNAGGVDKIYVEDDVNGEITVGDMRMVNGAMTGLTESDVVTKVRRRRRQ
ncbi:hypothetical protein Bca52824_014039 [Brassica carinata]|uniref:Transmembrane protein n=1 Tax=Brassica carinata TaxID=52824 RepID=A0A8X7VZL9_BRACI|nr:hypothetical protein Bca52824_014039 [Brassica carinata]